MPRRVSLPTADDLFRPTVVPDPETDDADAVPDEPAAGREAGEGTARTPSGRVRHDEKMTVYVTADELLDIEHTRLALRRTHALAVDRGRLVREAVAIALADFDANGADSVLVQRLAED
ncbi:MAG TPA: hypothetical protein VFJ19_10465 [Nocardioidaceae bacterium]|nr:hypothetical protein [Nocardioidaceae bacterium]